MGTDASRTIGFRYSDGAIFYLYFCRAELKCSVVFVSKAHGLDELVSLIYKGFFTTSLTVVVYKKYQPNRHGYNHDEQDNVRRIWTIFDIVQICPIYTWR